jgi:hypothetical protein
VVTVNGVPTTLTGGYTYRAPMTISSILPDVGLTEGGTTLTITGHNFLPYGLSAQPTLNDYVASGKVAHYDGVYNDKTSHNDSLNGWKDLTSNNLHATIPTPVSGAWGSRGLHLDGNRSSTPFVNSPTLNLASYSQQVRFKVDQMPASRYILSARWNGCGYTIELYGDGSFVQGSHNSSYMRTDANLIEGGREYVVIATYDWSTWERRLYLDGVLVKNDILAPSCSDLTGEINADLYIGGYAADPLVGTIYEEIIYDHALSAAEVLQNSRVSAARNMTVTLGSGSSAVECLNISIVSNDSLTCVTPAHAAGEVDVAVALGSETASISDGYEYEEKDINLTLTDNSVNLAGTIGDLWTDSLGANVKTNNPNGYNLQISASQPDLECASGLITHTLQALAAPFNAPIAMPDNRYGFNTGANQPTTWAGVTTGNPEIDSSNSATDPAQGRDTTIWFGTKVNLAQPACGNYTTSITFTALYNS